MWTTAPISATSSRLDVPGSERRLRQRPRRRRRALRLDDEERTYLFDLARAAGPVGRAPRPRRTANGVAPGVQWLLDSMTLSARPKLFVDGRMLPI
jgi:hypothetical protein